MLFCLGWRCGRDRRSAALGRNRRDIRGARLEPAILREHALAEELRHRMRLHDAPEIFGGRRDQQRRDQRSGHQHRGAG